MPIAWAWITTVPIYTFNVVLLVRPSFWTPKYMFSPSHSDPSTLFIIYYFAYTYTSADGQLQPLNNKLLFFISHPWYKYNKYDYTYIIFSTHVIFNNIIVNQQNLYIRMTTQCPARYLRIIVDENFCLLSYYSRLLFGEGEDTE